MGRGRQGGAGAGKVKEEPWQGSGMSHFTLTPKLCGSDRKGAGGDGREEGEEIEGGISEMVGRGG